MKNRYWKLGLRNATRVQEGFTLVEMLVVIIIIGVLATILIANFIGIKARGRDAQRKSDLKQIQTALEFYRSDNGSYPDSGTAVGKFPPASSCGTAFSNGTTTYMAKVPCDPSITTPGYVYTPTCASGICRTYSVTACLENSNDNDPNKDSTPYAGCTTSITYRNP